MRYHAIWMFAVGLLASGAGAADWTKGSQAVVLFGGAGGSSSEYDFNGPENDPVSGVGGAYGAQYFYTLTDHPSVAIGADIAVSPNGTREADDLLGGVDTDARLKSVVGMAIARLQFPRGTWRPYVFGGIGAHHSSLELSGRPRSGATWPNGGSDPRMLVDQEKTSVVLGTGVGIDIFVTERAFLGFELRNAWLLGLDTGLTAAGTAAGYRDDSDSIIAQGNIFMRVGVQF